jgi:predicted helicase
VPNLNPVIWNRINDSIGRDTSPEEILDYIYGILYSVDYREKYKEFLKVDFPRVPYPSNAEQFQMIAEKGNELIGFHLMKDADHWPISVTFPENGDNIIEELTWSAEEGGRVKINKTQYLGNVSAIAWNAFIGGYQPAQKWLKDRKGRALGFQDILHYGRILYALEQTDRIMKEIDEIGVV